MARSGEVIAAVRLYLTGVQRASMNMRMSLREQGSVVIVDLVVDVFRDRLIWDETWNTRVVSWEGWLNGNIAGGQGRWWSVVSRVANLRLRLLLTRRVPIGVHVRAMPGNVPRRRVQHQNAGEWSSKASHGSGKAPGGLGLNNNRKLKMSKRSSSSEQP